MTEQLSLTIPTSFGDIPLSADSRGHGRAVVLLHGGAGPLSMAGFADLLSDATGTRVIVPTHPGFAGAPRPEALTSVAQLAELYAGLLNALELDDATVIGNSLGGWIAAEVAIHRPARLGRLVVVDGVGIEVDGHPVSGSLPPAELIARSWYDPTRAPNIDPSGMPPAVREMLQANAATLALYGGSMSDPTLRGRLAAIDVPTLIVWGEADRIADPEHGRAFAAAIPDARFELLEHTGHVPQLETPDLLLGALRGFVVGSREG